MQPQSKLSFAVLIAVTLLTAVCATLLFPRTMHAISPPQRQRLIGRLPIERNEPITIRRVQAKGQNVRSNQKFSSEDDWLKGLTVSIGNKSEKAIVFAAIQLQFRRPQGSREPKAIESIEYGNNELLTRQLTANDLSCAITPGQFVDIKLTDERFDALTPGLAEIGYTNSGEIVDLRIDSVIFEDGTMWRAGSQFERDSLNPGRWNNSVLAQLKRTSESRPPTLAVSSRSPDIRPRPRGAIEPLSHRPSPSIVERFFSHAPVDSACHQDLWWSTVLSCGSGTNCVYPFDSMSLPTGGNYYGAAASALCKLGNTSCDVWKDTIIANTCGGGRGGGSLEDFDNGYGSSCSSDWDCGASYFCDLSSGTCQ